jgi:cytochrome b561
MQWRNTVSRYGAVAQALHWSLFVLVLLQVVGALSIDLFPRDSDGRRFMLAMHESLGITVALLVVFRIAWKLANPKLPGYGPPWQQRLAQVGHGALYLLMLAVPIVGYVVSSARGHDPAFFGITLPAVVGADRPLARSTKEVHEFLAWTLLALAAAHAALAVWHHAVLHDGVLRRMLPQRGGAAPEFHR